VLWCVAHGQDLLVSLKVTVKYPKSNLGLNAQMYLRGDNAGLSWNKGVFMSNVRTDEWLVTLNYTRLSAGTRMEMKALVNDKTWQIGCNDIVFLPSEDSSVTLYPFFFTYQGKYKVTKNIAPPPGSDILPRPLVIYTPPSYYENTYKPQRNVLVMHDGQNLFDDSTSFLGVSWRCQDTVDQLVVEGRMEEILIVGIYNTVDRIDEYTYSVDPKYGGGDGDAYLDYIQASVFPYVQTNYRVEMNQPNMGILGSSLGGLISCYAGWTRSSVYAKAGCMSTSFWWNDEDFNNVILVEDPAPNSSTYEVYLDSGDSGTDHDDRDQTIRVRDHIAQLGFTLDVNEFYYLDKGGQHSEYYWGARFWVPMIYLYPPTETDTVTPK
jgi:predicted alpha/beta superfamily hydrolase